MQCFSVTFERITEESAENGDFEEKGFELRNVTLREALGFLRWQGGHVEANCYPVRAPRWFTWYCESDYRTGETTNYSLHLPASLTEASRQRIARYVRCYGAN
jgi:hypothetical protein